MSDDREKLLRVMDNLESDYRSGKISAEKYSYFRSKYEDKLNSIDARDATRRIRSMQGKSPKSPGNKRQRKPTKNKKKEEQDLVQKYIINPKKSDAKYNKKKKPAMDSGTFKLLLILILVVGFTAGIAYGIFNLDFGSLSQGETVAVVDDTAFPEFTENVKLNTSANNQSNYGNYNYSSYSSTSVQTTADDSASNDYDDSSSSSSNSYQSNQRQSSSDSDSSSSNSRSSSQSNVETTTDGN